MAYIDSLGKDPPSPFGDPALRGASTLGAEGGADVAEVRPGAHQAGLDRQPNYDGDGHHVPAVDYFSAGWEL